jgi:hypothetical protein
MQKMRKILIYILGLFLYSFQPGHAQGNLLITPFRVVFEGDRQNEDVNLVNTGSDSATYSISFLHYAMTENGDFRTIDKPGEGQMFADPYLRIFPRLVTIAPRESQVVRIQFRKVPGIASGEYRSHLYFRAEKDVKPLGLEQTAGDQKQLSVQITPVFGLTIPVIIRNGEVKVTSEINGMKLTDGQNNIMNLQLTLNRKGNISTYGDLIAEYAPVAGKHIQIGEMRGIAVYTDIDHRNVSIRLNLQKRVNIHSGKIIVRFTSPRDTPYVLYAEKELILN